MSNCTGCGDQVFWFRKAEGGMHRPLESAGRTFVVIDDVVVETYCYDLHVCDEARATAYVANRVAIIEARRNLSRETHVRLRAAWAIAITKDCEKCEAVPGMKCINLRDREKFTVWPHEKRGNWVVELAHRAALEEQSG